MNTPRKTVYKDMSASSDSVAAAQSMGCDWGMHRSTGNPLSPTSPPSVSVYVVNNLPIYLARSVEAGVPILELPGFAIGFMG